LTTCSLPLDIKEDEIILRGICTPFHYSESKKKLKPEAFRPPPESNEVSIIRHTYVDVEVARNRSKDLETEGKTYIGMAVGPANCLVTDISKVVDSRVVFCGHGDVVFCFQMPPKGEVMPGEIQKKFRDTVSLFAKKFKVYIDPNPASDECLFTQTKLTYVEELTPPDSPASP